MSLKIVVRAPNHLGDCVMALPMINETREAYPGSTVTLLVREGLADLFENNPAVDAILSFPDRYAHGLAGIFKLRELIKHGGFDIGYILPPSFSSASAFKLAGVKERIGYISDGRRLLLTKALPLPEPINASHRSETYFNILRRTLGVELNYTKPKIFLSDDDIEHGNSMLRDFNVSDKDKYAVVAFRAVAESRRWGSDSYTRLVKVLVSAHNLIVLLVGLAQDRPEGDHIAAAAGGANVANLAGKTGIRELASILSQSAVFIGNDSGAAHLAAAVGAPVVILSGADDPNETTPLASRKRLLRRDQLDCISCVKNKCPLKENGYMRCMREITVEMVTNAIEELISAD